MVSIKLSQQRYVYTNYPASINSNSNQGRIVTYKPNQPNGNYMYQHFSPILPANVRRPYVVPPLRQVQQVPNKYDKYPHTLVRTPETPMKENVFPKQHLSTLSIPKSHNSFTKQMLSPIRTPVQLQNVDVTSNHSFTLNKEEPTNMILGASNSNVNNSFQPKLFGTTDREKMFIFTGTVEKVIKWNKIFINHFCYFEVIGSVISIQEGTIRLQKVMLLRDKKGPILQVIYYESTHIDIDDFYVGAMIRCVGSVNRNNVLNAVSIRNATTDEIDTLQRLSLICDQAISHYLNA